MALWMVRTGRYGQFEQRFLDDERIYLTWGELNYDLGSVSSRDELGEVLRRFYPDWSDRLFYSHRGQIWAFAGRMKPGDWVLVPSKKKSAVHVAEIVGPCTYDESGGECFYNHRRVKWIAKDVPRGNLDQDLRFSLQAVMTICEIKRNNAEARIREMAKTEWRAQSSAAMVMDVEATDEETELTTGFDLEQIAHEEIGRLIIQKFKGHGLARVVAAILEADGYTTYVSPEGPDKGVDILAAPGPLGFGAPRLCVQVKSGDAPVDRPTLDQLIGVMRNFRAEQGLLVSWGGFRTSVDREEASQFFQVRLWDADALVEELLEQYDRLPAEIRAELPLKRIWTVAAQSDDE